MSLRIGWSLVVLCFPAATALADEPQTIAETSEYRATSRYSDVVGFMDSIVKRSPIARRVDMGKTVEGRVIPMIILADPPVATPEEARKSGKLVVFAMGNIHAGEVCGKEALQMLAREIASKPHHPLLKDLVIVFAPIYNCDGNERMSKDNRPGQNGPADGMGQRENADGLDLNRDFVKLAAPETRALVAFYNAWNPALMIDTHTTDGSFHRYTITYSGPMHPASGPIVEFVRDRMLPSITRSLEKETGYKSFFYGNFEADHSRWETFSAQPRFGTNYFGLRGGVAILSEAYTYATFRDRVLATREFVRGCLTYAAEHRKEVAEQVKSRSVESDVPIRTVIAMADAPVKLLGFVETEQDGHRAVTDQTKDYEAELFNRFSAAKSVRRPFAYLFPASYSAAAETLQHHGIEVDVIREDIELAIEAYRVDHLKRSEQPFQKHVLVDIEATARSEKRQFPAGTIVVRTNQPLGTLAVCLLEPEAEDGLATWGFFDDGLKEGEDFAVRRIIVQSDLPIRRTQPIAAHTPGDR